MNIEQVPIGVYKTSINHVIDVLPTDTLPVIQAKIQETVNPLHPSFVYLPKDFDKDSFFQKTKTFMILDIFNTPFAWVIPKESKFDLLGQEINEIQKNYEIDNITVSFQCLYRVLYILNTNNKLNEIMRNLKKKSGKSKLPSSAKVKLPSSAKSKLPSGGAQGGRIPIPRGGAQGGRIPVMPITTYKSFYINDEITSTESSNFQINLRKYYEKTEKDYIIKGIIQARLHDNIVKNFIAQLEQFNPTIKQNIFSNLVKIYRQNVLLQKKNNEIILESGKIQKILTDITGIEYEPIEELGTVYSIDIVTSIYSCGTLFNELELTEELPFATYKNFLKYRNGEKIFDEQKSAQTNCLQIFRHEIRKRKKIERDTNDEVQIFIKNIPNGIHLQVLLLANSTINTLENVYEFLKMDKTLFTVQSVNEKGFLGNVFFHNNPPGTDVQEEKKYWKSAFQPPILSNLILNNPTFNYFLYLNDSEKISKDNNSIYVYYKSSDKSVEENRDIIHVGGWNRLSSRFGDLTAIFYPVKIKDDFLIQVKIIRSFNRNVVDNFILILSKLIQLYNYLLKEQIQIFKTFDPYYEPITVDAQNVSTKENTLPYIEPLIFTKNVYSRKCQKVPPVIVPIGSELPDEQTIIFPLNVVYHEGEKLLPRKYFCNDESYKYPGLIDMKNKVPNHPIGYAPCCYQESHAEKNKMKLEKHTKHVDKKIKIIDKNKYILNSEKKIITNLGQMAKIPQNIENLLISLDPTVNYFRFGMPISWENSSLLACCLYIKQKKSLDLIKKIKEKDVSSLTDKEKRILDNENNFSYLPRHLESRLQLSNYPLQVGSQENTIHGIEELKTKIQNTNEKLNVRELFSILQKYFSINLFVIDSNGNFVLPFSEFNFLTCFNENYDSIFLIEHYGQLRYEIIVKQTKDGDILYSFSSGKSQNLILKKLYYNIYETKILNLNLQNCANPLKFFEKYKIIPSIKSQILSSNGQTRFVILKQDIPCFLIEPQIPFQVKITKELPDLATEEEVNKYLLAMNFEHVYRYYYEKYCFVEIESEIIIPCVKAVGNPNEKKLLKRHEVLFFFLYTNNNSEEILKTRIYSNIVKDYILIMFGNFLKMVKDSDTPVPVLNNIDETIDSFFSLYITWIDIIPNIEKMNFSIFVEENKDIYQNGKLSIPVILEEKITFLLKWNIMNNPQIFETNYNVLELQSFYEYPSQFKKMNGQTIQTGNELYDSKPYHTIYSNENPILYYFMKQNVFYYYSPIDSVNIYPFFYTEKKMTEIHSIIGHYYDTGIFDWNVKISKKKVTSLKMEKMPLQLGDDEFVIYPFINQNVKKKKSKDFSYIYMVVFQFVFQED